MDNFAFPVPHGGNRVKGLCNGVVKNGPDRFRVDDGRFLREPVAAKGDDFAERSRLIIEKSLLGRIEGNFASFKGRIINTDFLRLPFQLRHRYEHIHLAAVDRFFYGVPQPVFQGHVSTRHTNIKFEKTLIDSLYFYRNGQFPVTERAAAEPGHAAQC